MIIKIFARGFFFYFYNIKPTKLRKFGTKFAISICIVFFIRNAPVFASDPSTSEPASFTTPDSGFIDPGEGIRITLGLGTEERNTNFGL